jgi:alcohol dehydrogenase (cytochrome c)
VPIAFDPTSGLVYASTWDVPRVQKIAPAKPAVVGANSTGVVARVPPVKPGAVLGHFVAIDPLTGEKKWEVPLTDLPGSAGMLATGGGLVFSGKLTGEFVALDAATGRTVWQFKTGSSINATAITYTHNGRQYVTVASGRGGLLASRYTQDKVPTGGSIWTFALLPE